MNMNTKVRRNESERRQELLFLKPTKENKVKASDKLHSEVLKYGVNGSGYFSDKQVRNSAAINRL